MDERSLYYAVPNHEEVAYLADSWFWQIGDTWVAVFSAYETDWFDDWISDLEYDRDHPRPSPFTYPISQMPPSGMIHWCDREGNEYEQPVIGKPPVYVDDRKTPLDNVGQLQDFLSQFPREQNIGYFMKGEDRLEISEGFADHGEDHYPMIVLSWNGQTWKEY